MEQAIDRRDAILDIVAREARIERDRLAPDATLVSLGIASLDVVSVLFAIEDEFGVDVPPEDLADAGTVAQFVDRIVARVETA